MDPVHLRHNPEKLSTRCFPVTIDMQALKNYRAYQNNKGSNSSPIVNISIFYQNLHYLKIYTNI